MVKVDPHVDGLPTKGDYLAYVGPYNEYITRGKEYKVQTTGYRVSCGFQVLIYDDDNNASWIFLNYFNWAQ